MTEESNPLPLLSELVERETEAILERAFGGNDTDGRREARDKVAALEIEMAAAREALTKKTRKGVESKPDGEQKKRGRRPRGSEAPPSAPALT